MLCGAAVVVALAASVAPAAGSGGPIDGVVITNTWRVVKVSPAPTVVGSWSDCVTIRAGGRDATATCSRAFAVANGKSGSIGATDGVISASVGFDVTKTQTITATGAFPVAKRTKRTVQWAPRYKVKQLQTEKVRCVASRTHPKTCKVVGHGSGTARQAAGVKFRIVR